MNSTFNVTSTDGTEKNNIILTISIVEASVIIILNSFLLVLCCKIPTQIKSQLHIFYTFLGAADLMNGCVLLGLYSITESNIFNYYYMCASIITLANIGVAITGYMLLLLTFVKCFSIVCPMKSIRLVTKSFSICTSVTVWFICFVILLVPVPLWRREQVYISNESCSASMVYHKYHRQFTRLGAALSAIFIAGVTLLNTVIVVVICKRGNKIGVVEDTSNDRKSGTKTKIFTGVVDRTSQDRESFTKTKIFTVQSAPCNIMEPENRKIEMERKCCVSNSKYNSGYNFRKSKNFKAYITVLMHVGCYMVCGFPTLFVYADEKLKESFYNNRNVRFICALFVYLTSLINPILTLTRIPAFRTVLTKEVSKWKRTSRFFINK